jgi:lipoprotein-releasing system permease protein
MAKKLVFEAGTFNLASPQVILIGAELARNLGLRLGDWVSFLSLTGTSLTVNVPEHAQYRVGGIFRTGFYEYDSTWAFIPIDRALELVGADSPVTLGIKLKNQWNDGGAMGELRSIPGLRNAPIVSWREYNRAFFGALRMEKLLMFILVALIFVVVGLNIFQAQRRNVLERRDEIALLRAVGASETAVRLVFVLDGLIIGLIGALGGLLPGLWIAFHIGQFFSLLERIVNGTLGFLDVLIRPFVGTLAEGDFRVFSPTVFYIKEIPSRVIPQEVLVVFLFGVLSATLAAWLASGKTARIKPAEVLRDE